MLPCAPLRSKRIRLGTILAASVTILFIAISRYQSDSHGFNLSGHLQMNHGVSSLATKPPILMAPVTKKALNTTLLERTPKYVQAIMTPGDTSFARLDCPAPNRERYAHLSSGGSGIKYFFALDLHQCAPILPRLLGSIIDTMRFVGPERCALSIVEGRSTDGTYEVLLAMRKEVEQLGAEYFLVSSDLEPLKDDRISGLAALRNLALQPLTSNSIGYAKDATVIFLNDVSLCMEDILELVHQRTYQGADMTCAMDWTYVGPDPTFYDVWIARGMTGESFFNIPNDGNYNSAWDLFWNDAKAQTALFSHKSFQSNIEFRRSREDECYKGEPELFCKDMWYNGYGKIAVVPSVNLEYSDEQARKIKALKGFASQWIAGDTDKIEWVKEPPATVKCMENWGNQVFRPWDEALS